MTTTEHYNVTRTEADAVAEVVKASTEPQLLAGHTWVIPQGAQQVDMASALERQQPRPNRRRGSVTAHDAAALVALVTELGAEHGSTRIYADIVTAATPTITAVLNDHDGTAVADDGSHAGWGDHRVVLPVHRTPAWERWLKHNEQMLEQVKFGQHIEDNLRDVASPDGADLLEMALTFEQTTSAEFRSVQRLNRDTRQVTYVETAEAKAGQSGQLQIPEWIELHLAPFEGSEPIRIEARLRTSARDGKLTIGYRLDRPDEVERNALDSIVEEIASGTGIRPLLAKPPATS